MFSLSNDLQPSLLSTVDRLMSSNQKTPKNEGFEDTLETAPFPIYEIDYKTPRFLRVNEATCKISGYTKQELLSINPSALLDVGSAQRFKERIKQGLAGQKIDESVEFKLKAKDGHDVWTVLHVKPTYKNGKLDSALVVAYDITERKKAEEALMKAKEQTEFDRKRLETLLEATPAAVVIVEAADGRFSFVNKRAMQLYGFDTLGLDLKENVAKVKARRPDGSIYPIEEMPVSRSLRFGIEVHNEEMIIENAKGRAFPIIASTAPLRDIQGNITAAIVVWEDITERKKAEDEIKASENKYHSLFTNMIDGFAYHKIVLDKTGKPSDYVFLEVNHAFEELTGLRREKIIGKKVTEVLPGIENDSADWIGTYGKVALTGKPVEFENFAEPLGQWYRVSAYCPERGFFVAAFENITELKKAEENLKKTLEKEHFLAEIVRKASVALAVGYPDGSIGQVNDAFERLTGYSQEELKQITWNTVLTPPEYFNFEKTKLKELEKTKKPVQYEKEYIKKDGSRVPIELFVHPFLDKEGNTTHYFAFITDITERKKTEEAIKESESTLQNIIDGSPAFIFLKDRGGRFITINKLLEESLGMKREELRGKTDHDIFSKEVADYYRKNDLKVLETKLPIQTEEIFDSPDGKKYTLLANKFPLFNSSGEVIATCSISLDITERKKAEEALKHRNRDLEQLQLRLEAKAAEVEEYATRMEELVEERTSSVKRQASLIDLSPDAIIVRGLDGIISFWSVGAEKLYGWTAQEAVGQVSQDLLKTVFPISQPEIIAEIRVTGSWSGEIRHKTKDGRDVIVESRWLAERNRTGRVIDILESNVNITERKKAEAAVLSERQRLFDVLETMPAMVCLITSDYHIAFANRSFRDRFGESKGRPCFEFCWGQSEPCKFCESLIPLKTGKPHNWEVTGPDGSVIEAHDYPFTDIDGKRLVLEMDIDITTRKKAEAQALESARKLKDAERLAAIGATAGMVGHDIRNPLQAITSDVYLAKSELANLPNSEEKKNILESLEETEKNIDYINKIVQDLQDYTRPINPKIEESDLNQVFEGILKKNGIPSNVDVNVRISKDARAIKADAYYLNRIMSNLITNAVQAMPQGGKLNIKAHKEKGETVIAVEDTGVGIPKDVQAKIFTLMFTTKSKGQGFGLPVVKRMTESLCGTVTFESEVGKGTKFIVRLPPPKK